MTTAYTSLLGLALPVTGELQGTWGDTVNNYITSYLDAAVAGTQTLSTDADVTLTKTTNASLSSTSSQYSILLFSGARTAQRTVTVPAASKIYTVINKTTGGYAVKVVGSGPTTGITIANGESAVIAWNGSDFIKISNTAGGGSFTDLTATGTITFNTTTNSQSYTTTGAGTITISSGTAGSINNMNIGATTAGTGKFTALTNTALTSGRVVYSTTGGLETDSANLTFDGTSLTLGGNPTLSAGTANGVLYLNASKVATSGSALTFDGTTLTTTGRIAVSGTNPSIRQTVQNAYLDLCGGTTVGVDPSIQLAGSTTAGDANSVFYNTNNHVFRSSSGASEYMRLTSTGLGIGTSSPGFKLDVNGVAAIRAGNAIRYYRADNAIYTQLYDAGTSGFTLDNTNGDGFRFQSAGTNQLVLNSSGNLGLGVTPSASDGTLKYVTVGNVGNSFAGFNGGLTSYVLAGAYYNSGWKYAVSSSAVARYDVGAGTHAWYTAPSGTAGNAISFTQAMTLDASGNLGIGTSSPAYKLDIVGTGDTSLRARTTGTVNSASVLIYNGNGTTAAGYSYLRFVNEDTNTQDWRIGTYGNNNLSIVNAKAGTTPVVLDTSGNLGIGTSSPGGKLEVYSGASGATAVSNGTNLIIQNSTAVGMSLLAPDANACRIYFGTASNNRNAFIYSDYNSGAQTLIFGVGTSTVAATERMRIDSSGNLGLGVTPPTGSNQAGIFLSGTNNVFGGAGNGASFTSNVYNSSGTWKYATSSFATLYQQTSGQHVFYTAASGTATNNISWTQAMTLDASGKLAIANTSPGTTLSIGSGATGGYNGGVYLNRGAGVYNFYEASDGTNTVIFGLDHTLSAAKIGTINSYPIAFYTGNVERARITSGGYFKASNTGSYQGSTSGYHELRTDNNTYIAYFTNSNAAPNGTVIEYGGAAPNGTGNLFLYCGDTGGERASVRSNGGLANYSGNNVNLSDRREKTNFAPAKSYLDTICAIPVQTFNYIDQAEDDPGLTLGVVAQDVQAVAPELVHESNWGTEEDPKMRLSIYQTDLQYALMKCIQELKAEVDSLKAQLKGA